MTIIFLAWDTYRVLSDLLRALIFYFLCCQPYLLLIFIIVTI